MRVSKKRDWKTWKDILPPFVERKRKRGMTLAEMQGAAKTAIDIYYGTA